MTSKANMIPDTPIIGTSSLVIASVVIIVNTILPISSNAVAFPIK